MEIKTNHRPHPLISWMDLTAAAQSEHAEWEPDDPEDRLVPRFFWYHKTLYCITDMMPASGIGIRGWDVYHPHDFGSGIVAAEWDEDEDFVVVGRYFAG